MCVAVRSSICETNWRDTMKGLDESPMFSQDATEHSSFEERCFFPAE
jgi:hypothetical protein